MDGLSNCWRAFRLSPGKWILAFIEVGLLVGERCFEVATLVQYAQNGDRYWCIEEESCKFKNATCNDKCLLPSHPDKDEDHCNRCPFGYLWCLEELRCYDPVNEPCNKECYENGYKKYCSATNSCTESWLPCETLISTESRANDADNRV